MDLKQEPTHPIVIFVRGLPGSGKTYLATQLKKVLGEDVIMLDPDATDYSSREYLEHTKALTAEGVDPKLHAYRFLRAKAYDGIAKRKLIIWNQPFTNLEIFHKVVARLHEQAAAHDTELRILVVEVEIDPEIAKNRVAERKQRGGHGPSEGTFSRFANDYKTFASEGYDTVTVNGEDDASVSAAIVIKALESKI